jgi:uroporphyrinogen-III decarboxylase
MLTPGTKVLEDICDWEKTVKFPDLDDYNFKETAARFIRDTYDANKVLHVNIHQGLTEMLVALLGGYAEGMLALAMEPEACSDFFARFAKHMTDFFDFLDALYPIDFITYHDDWGTERDTFFSSKMMEELVFEPTKTIVDHIKGKGKVFELHSCGKIERFLPYMCDLNIDFLQIQRRANDMPELKRLYGDKIGFNAALEGEEPGENCPEEVLLEMVRKTVDVYGAGGGFYPAIFGADPERVWKIVSEFYCYSREFYENQK